MGDLPPQIHALLMEKLGDVSVGVRPFLELAPGVPANVEVMRGILNHLEFHRILDTVMVVPEINALRVVLVADPPGANIPMTRLSARVIIYMRTPPAHLVEDDEYPDYDEDTMELPYMHVKDFTTNSVKGVAEAMTWMCKTVAHVRMRGFCKPCLVLDHKIRWGAAARLRAVCGGSHARASECSRRGPKSQAMPHTFNGARAKCEKGGGDAVAGSGRGERVQNGKNRGRQGPILMAQRPQGRIGCDDLLDDSEPNLRRAVATLWFPQRRSHKCGVWGTSGSLRA
jgi:hypothetical protein